MNKLTMRRPYAGDARHPKVRMLSAAELAAAFWYPFYGEYPFHAFTSPPALGDVVVTLCGRRGAAYLNAKREGGWYCGHCVRILRATGRKAARDA